MIADVPAPQGSPSSVAPTVAHRPSIGDAVVSLDDGGALVAPSHWPLTDEAFADGPWVCVARTGVSLRVDDLADLAASTASELEAAAVGRLACRPVWSDGHLTGVAVAFGDAADTIDLDPELAARAPAIDALTGVASSGGLQDEIDAGDGDAAVLYVDLDGLDRVNATYGSDGGDAVLIEVARRLERAVRHGDRTFRMTGDEFVVVIRGAEELESIQTAARVLDELALPYEVNGADGVGELVSVTAGVGMCVPSEGTAFDLAVFVALNALGEAKSAGRDRLHVVGR